MPIETPALAVLAAMDTDYTAKIDANFSKISDAFATVNSITNDATFLSGVIPLAAALGLAIPTSGALSLPAITPLGMGTPSGTYITSLNHNFSQVEAAFGDTAGLTAGVNSLAALGRFMAAVLGGKPCLIGNHSYFSAGAQDIARVQPGYAWLPSIPAVVHSAVEVDQFLGGGNPYGEFWYMVIDKTGKPAWLLGEEGDTIISTSSSSFIRTKGNGLPSLPFFRASVNLDLGTVWTIRPPEQLLPIFQLAPEPLVDTPRHP